MGVPQVNPHQRLDTALRNGFLFFSGQVSVDEEWRVVGDTFEEKARQMFCNIISALEAVGADTAMTGRVCLLDGSPAAPR